MNSQRALLLLVFAVVVFLPSLMDWATEHAENWFRPQLLWFALIVVIFLEVRKNLKNEL